jgi:hypothetical protein
VPNRDMGNEHWILLRISGQVGGRVLFWVDVCRILSWLLASILPRLVARFGSFGSLVSYLALLPCSLWFLWFPGFVSRLAPLLAVLVCPLARWWYLV